MPTSFPEFQATINKGAFIHSFIQLMFAAHRLRVRLCPRLWELVPVWSLIVKSYNFDASGYTQDETDGRQVINFCINSYTSHGLNTQPFVTVADLPSLWEALLTPTIAIVLGSQDPWTGSLSKWSPHSIAVLIQQADKSLPPWIHIRRDRVSLIFYCPLLKVSAHRVSLHGSVSVSEQTNLALVSLLYPFLGLLCPSKGISDTPFYSKNHQ